MSWGFINHLYVTVYCIGQIGVEGLFSDEIYISFQDIPEFILDFDKLEKAFSTGKPDKDVNVTFWPRLPPCE